MDSAQRTTAPTMSSDGTSASKMMVQRPSAPLRVVLSILLVGVLTAPAYAKHKKKPHKTPTPVAGAFDYYVMSLSWSPEHCAEPAGSGDALQCNSARKFGFVLHGLWPQFEKGFPQSCSKVPLSDATRDSMLDIMPSKKLVQHEWEKHGTCSGLTPDAYFAGARTAFTSVKIPALFQDPPNAFSTTVSKVEQGFSDANPAFHSDGIAVLCAGKFLQEVRVCLDKDLHPRACGHDVKDHCKKGITVRPVK